MNELSIINISLRDFFTKSILKLALFPLIITTAVMYLLFFSAAGEIVESLENSVLKVEHKKQIVKNEQIQKEEVSETYTGYAIIDYLLNHSLTSWLVGFLIYTVGAVFIMMFSIFIALIILGFLTPRILAIIHKRHYLGLAISGYGTAASSVWFFIKHTIIMIILFLILMPLYFIPGINIVAVNLPFFYFFYKLLNYDVTSILMNEDEYAIIKQRYKNEIRLKTLGLYFISMIPFVALFSTVFFVVYLGHTYMSKLEKIRE